MIDGLELEFPDNNLLAFTVGLPLALAYADVGLDGYNRFAQAFEEAQSSGVALAHEQGIGAIAPAMVLAFSAELLLKLLVFQRTGSFPRGHKLKDLYKKLSFDARESIRKRYDDCVARPGRPLALRYQLNLHPAPERFEKMIESDSQGDSFEIALQHASPMFEKLRYLFEEVADGFTENVDFSWLIYIVDALRTEILSHEDGQVTISMKW